MKFLGVSADPRVGKQKVYKSIPPANEGVPDSEYRSAYVWGDDRDALIKLNPNGECNRKKLVNTYSEKSLQYTLGGPECDWEEEADKSRADREYVMIPSVAEIEDTDKETLKSVAAIPPAKAKNSSYVKSTESIGDVNTSIPLKITKRPGMFRKSM